MTAAVEYVRAGMALVPIPSGRKGPTARGWQTRERCITEEAGASRINGGNIGIAHAYCTPAPTCALDIDACDAADAWLRAQGIDMMALLAADDAVQIRSGRPGRAKLLYRLPHIMPTVQPDGSGLELRCASRDGMTVQDVLPPSIHPETSKPYEWRGDWRAIPAIPPALLAVWQSLIVPPRAPSSASVPAGARIAAGGRNAALTSMAGSMRKRAMTADAIEAALLAENAARCDPPLPDADVRRIARSVGRYAPALPPTDEWPEPAPLPSGLLPVASFDTALLPEPLRAWVADIAERTQCPLEYPAVGALVAIGSVLGRKLAIRPKQRDDWHEFANLWGVVIGPPGVLKSPALNEALRPLRKLEVIAYEQYEQELGAWRADREAARIHRDAARDNARKAARKGMQFDAAALVLDDDAEEPQPRRYVVNDCTPEALGVVLAKNPNGVLAYRDELAGLLASMDREGMEGARQFYLSAYSGKEPYTFDRITRGRTRIEACCVSLLGSTQPAVMSRYIREAVTSGGGDGLLSRFSLLVWPDLSSEWRNVDRWPESDAREQVTELFERLDQVFPASIGAEGEAGQMPFLRLDDAARELFLEWRTALEGRLRDPSSTEHPALIAHLAKYRKLVPALALLFHVAEVGSGAIAEPSVLRALAWAELLESHARRAYGAIGQAHADGARALLSKLRAGKLSSPFVLRDVYRAAWAHLSEPEQARRAAELLAEFDYLRAEEIQTAGRPRVQYRVNPRALA